MNVSSLAADALEDVWVVEGVVEVDLLLGGDLVLRRVARQPLQHERLARPRLGDQVDGAEPPEKFKTVNLQKRLFLDVHHAGKMMMHQCYALMNSDRFNKK